MSGFFDKFYKKSSMTGKALSLLPSYTVFHKWYHFLKKSQWWDRDRLEEYQRERLSALLHHAYENVPYYHRVFDERGLKPKDIQDFKDLRQLPYLTKDIVRANMKDMMARNYPPEKFEYATTSGTTAGVLGTLGMYYETGVSRAIEWAFMKTQWDRVGYHFFDKCMVLRGYGSTEGYQGKFSKYSFFHRWLLLSPFLLSDENFSRYTEKIRRFQPKYVQAFPSEIYLLAKYMKYHNATPFPSIKALLLGSEHLYPFQRQFLVEMFQCRVYSWYGLAEQVVLAGECERSTNYHIFPEYGIVELVSQHGDIINREDILGEIVATGLNNYVMPLIRYRTKDLAKISNSNCSCGRHYPLITDLEGRFQEMIIGKDNQLISLTAVLAAIKRFEGFPQIKKLQFIQEEQGKLIASIVKGPLYTIEDERDILENAKKNFGDMLSIEIQYLDDIPPTHSGKHRALIQKLPIDFGDFNDDKKN